MLTARLAMDSVVADGTCCICCFRLGEAGAGSAFICREEDLQPSDLQCPQSSRPQEMSTTQTLSCHFKERSIFAPLFRKISITAPKAMKESNAACFKKRVAGKDSKPGNGRTSGKAEEDDLEILEEKLLGKETRAKDAQAGKLASSGSGLTARALEKASDAEMTIVEKWPKQLRLILTMKSKGLKGLWLSTLR